MDRILASRGFRSSKRLQSFLTFIVERTLAGRDGEIKEYVIATEVYDKTADYDPHVDSSVRVEATRLRTRLREYYEGPGSAEKVRVQLPRGGYVPVFERPLPPPEGETETAQRSGWAAGLRIASIGALAALIGATVAWNWSAASIEPEPRAVFQPLPLTSDPGIEGAPALSPDGHNVAFAGSSGGAYEANIFVRQVDSDAMLQLTPSTARQGSPTWSPDGTRIAFLRWVTDRRSAIVLISALGGRERVLEEVETPPEAGISWSPDGSFVGVIERLGDGAQRACRFRLIPVDGGEEPSVPFSLASFSKATHPAFSPDGSLVAFLGTSSSWAASLYVADLSGDSVRKLADLNGNGAGTAWTADGGELIVGRYTPLRLQALLRVRLDDASVSEITVGADPSEPSISGDGSRLVYSEKSSRFDITRFGLRGNDVANDRFIASTRFDGNPQYSPDGSRIAFASARSGQIDIWIAADDGSGAVALTTVGKCGSPRWSPDGSRIAFDSSFGGNVDIYSVSVDSGELQQVTHSEAEDAVPSWSPDGQQIYFASDRTGTPQIWRIPAAEGSGRSAEATQLTQDGGFYPQVSPDGKHLYFAKERADRTSLWRMPLSDRRAGRILDQLQSGYANWQVTNSGVYFIDRELGGATEWSLWLLNPDSGAKQRVQPFFRWENGGKPSIGGPGLSVSPDGAWVLVGHTWLTSDLMLIDEFH